MVMLCNSQVLAQISNGEKTLEYQIALFHYNLITLTKWPDGIMGDELIFCIELRHPLRDEFSKIFAKKKAFNKSINMTVLYPEQQKSLQNCNVIALSKYSEINEEALSLIKPLPILTIGIDDDITKSGGIAYIPSSGNINLPKVSYQSLKDSGLNMNAWFLESSLKKWKQ